MNTTKLQQLLLIVLSIAVSPALSQAQLTGDTTIPWVDVTPLNTQTQAAMDAGLLALQAYDPVAAGEIQAAVNNGSLDLAELTDSNVAAGFKGMTDGNTISVRLNDGIDAGTVGVRLRHEWYHWKNGSANPPFNGGELNDCQHFQAWAETYDHLAYISCDFGYIVTCPQVLNVHDEMAEFYLLCVDGGGTAVWPPNPPPVCCQ